MRLLWLLWAAFLPLLGVPAAPLGHLAVEDPLVASLDVLLSTGSKAPIEWDYARVKYSLTVPFEALAAALLVVAKPGYDGVELALYWPEDASREALVSGRPSSFADVPTEEAARFILEVRYGSLASNYTVSVLRSTITSRFDFAVEDPAENVPPQGTLVGLSIHGATGDVARTEPPSFTPRRSQYVAMVDIDVPSVWIIASKNDPEASLELRVDGQEWEALPSGVNSPWWWTPARGWLLIEVRVTSPTAAALAGRPPLVYQVVIARGALCHERCRSCFGTGEDHCVSCRAPLVLSDGRCEATACPPNGYYKWESYQCRVCDSSCEQCAGPGREACTLCPPLFFLSPERFRDPTGLCTIRCPTGTFAHPPSRRCRRPPATAVKTFYLRFVFRVSFHEFQYDSRMQRSVLNATAFVLGLSLTDVRAYRLDSRGQVLQIIIEVVSPFLKKADADRVTIDSWFGAFEIPVDEIESLTWDAVHPPLPPLSEDPFVPTWAMGLIMSAVMGVFVVCPMYCIYFRRLRNTRKRYATRVGIDMVFVDLIVNQSPAWIIRKFVANADGERAFQGQDPSLQGPD